MYCSYDGRHSAVGPVQSTARSPAFIDNPLKVRLQQHATDERNHKDEYRFSLATGGFQESLTGLETFDLDSSSTSPTRSLVLGLILLITPVTIIVTNQSCGRVKVTWSTCKTANCTGAAHPAVQSCIQSED